MFHSIGGGTGSGLGSYILNSRCSIIMSNNYEILVLKDNFEKTFKFTASVFPSKDDDVAVSPYNSIFSINELLQCADCVLPIDNQALMNIFKNIENPLRKKGPSDNQIFGSNEQAKIKGSKLSEIGEETKKTKPFDKMNNVIAHLLSNLTWYICILKQLTNDSLAQ